MLNSETKARKAGILVGGRDGVDGGTSGNENYSCIDDEELLFRHSCQSPAPAGVQDESESIRFKIFWFN